MTHDPEVLAAAYLERATQWSSTDFDGHLLTCDACWREVCLARAGREIGEAARELAPAGIRADIRATIAAAAVGQSHSRRYPRRALAIAGVVALILIGTAIIVSPWQRVSTPTANVVTPKTAVSAAIAEFRANQLPGTDVPETAAPDLTSIGLHLVAAGAGHMDGARVTVFAYRDSAGNRLSVYQSDRPFPEVAESQHLGADQDAWTVRSDGVSVLCAKGDHAVLLLSSMAPLVDSAGALLDAI